MTDQHRKLRIRMESDKIFRIVRAEVNPFIVHCIASPDKYWRRLERALGVKVKQDQLYEKVEIEGKWSQLKKVKSELTTISKSEENSQKRALVDHLFETDNGSESSTARGGSSDSVEVTSMVSGMTMNTTELLNYRVSPDPDHPRNRKTKPAEEKPQLMRHRGQSSRHGYNESRYTREDDDLSTYPIEDDVRRTNTRSVWKEPALAENVEVTNDETEFMQVDSDIYDYLKKFEKDKIDRIALSNRVEINSEHYEDVTNITIHPDKSLKSRMISKVGRAKEELISLYQTAYLSLKVELIDTADVRIDDDIIDTIVDSSELSLIPVIARPSKSHELSLIGKSNDVQEASRIFLKKLGLYSEPISKERDMKTRNSSRKSAQRQADGQGQSQGQPRQNPTRSEWDEQKDYPQDYGATIDEPAGLYPRLDVHGGNNDTSFQVFKTKEGLPVKLVVGDIVNEVTDVIVNSANSDLEHISGVARSIEKAAGIQLTQDCAAYIREQGKLPPSKVIHTEACGLLKCRYVIHAVPPFWDEQQAEKIEKLLARTFYNTLIYANYKLQAQSIAIPVMGTGVFGVPLDVCGRALHRAIRRFSGEHADEMLLTMIRVINHNNDTAFYMNAVFEGLFDVAVSGDFDQRTIDEESREERVHSPNKDVAWYHNFLHSKTEDERVADVSPNFSDKRSFESSRTQHSVVSDQLSDRAPQRHTEARIRTTPDHISRKRPERETYRHTSSGLSHDYASLPPYLGNRDDYTHNLPSRHVTDVSYRGVRTRSPERQAGNMRSRQSPEDADERMKKATSRHTTIENHLTRLAGSSGMDSPAARHDNIVSRDVRKINNAAGSDIRNPNNAIGIDIRKPNNSLEAGVYKPNNALVSDIRNPPAREVVKCPICLDTCSQAITLPQCGHVFCKSCIDDYFTKYKPVCPSCGEIYGKIHGDQPADGQMTSEVRHDIHLPGHEDMGTIVITYSFPDGTQGPNHPSPGKPYKAVMRLAYLPANPEGRTVCKLLKKAFNQGLTFTVGESRTTGQSGVITWNDIHHKTNIHGGPTRFGYPDPDYLSRVRAELQDKGIH